DELDYSNDSSSTSSNCYLKTPAAPVRRRRIVEHKIKVNAMSRERRTKRHQ
ncbi:hypothetical protein NPIL_255061, partial [Nephila pilipes]